MDEIAQKRQEDLSLEDGKQKLGRFAGVAPTVILLVQTGQAD